MADVNVCFASRETASEEPNTSFFSLQHWPINATRSQKLQYLSYGHLAMQPALLWCCSLFACGCPSPPTASLAGEIKSCSSESSQDVEYWQDSFSSLRSASMSQPSAWLSVRPLWMEHYTTWIVYLRTGWPTFCLSLRLPLVRCCWHCFLVLSVVFFVESVFVCSVVQVVDLPLVVAVLATPG